MRLGKSRQFTVPNGCLQVGKDNIINLANVRDLLAKWDYAESRLTDIGKLLQGIHPGNIASVGNDPIVTGVASALERANPRPQTPMWQGVRPLEDKP